MTAAVVGGEANALTVLRPVDRRRMATKTYTIASNGRVLRQEFGEAATFAAELVMVDGIEGLHRLLYQLEDDPRAFVIRGAPKETTNLQHTRRTLRKDGGAFMDVPRGWFSIDADKLPLPDGYSVLADPEDVARYLVEFFAGFAPELEGVSCVVQFSSSAGIGEMAEAELAAGLPDRWGDLAKQGRVSAHLWFWLAVPQDGASLLRWAETINAAAGNKVVDRALMNAIQAHYTAGPVFGPGLRDPLKGRRTVLVQGSADAAILDIPPEPPRGERTSSSGFSAGVGFAGRLEQIGETHGFHLQINSAIASYIASNWPQVDEDALVAVLQARIHEAPRGTRPQSEIDRYADDAMLRPRIQAIMGFQRDNADKARAEREAAEAVPPTFPDLGVTLAEGERLAAEAVDGFADRVRAGERPERLLQVTVGAGKTEAAVMGAAAMLEAARAGGLEGALFFLVPRHDLGGEIVQRIAAAHPDLTVATWRGMDAADPETPGKTMCLDPELPKAASAAGLSSTAVCSACPLRGECGHQRQRLQRADVWVAAHQLAFQAKPTTLPKAAVLVVDEGFWQAGVVGLDGHPPQLALSALEDGRTGVLTGTDQDRLIFLRGLVGRVLAEHGPGRLRREAFEAAGLTAEGAGEWHALEWRTKPDVRFDPLGSSRASILEGIEAAREAAGFSGRRAKLAGFVRDLLAGSDATSIHAELIPDADLGGGQGTGPVVRMAWRDGFAQWAAEPAKLFLDATTRPDVLRPWSPDLEVVSIEVSAPNQHVRQVVGREFGRSSFTQNPNNVGRLADLVMVELAEAGGGAVLVVGQVAVEDMLRVELERRFGGTLPERLHLAHHGALTGMNQWQDVARVLVVGRPAVNRVDGERRAEIVKGGPVDRLQDGALSLWPQAPAGVRRADGSGVRIDQPHHPDKLVEAVRWSITEGAVLQAIGRARGVRRADRVQITLLGNMALPLTVAEITTWEDLVPDRLTVAAAEAALVGRALPLAPVDMAAARPDLWGSETAAKRGLAGGGEVKGSDPLIPGRDKGIGPFSGLTPARYRKPGARRWSAALVPVEDGEAALRAVVGELAAFDLAPAPQPAAVPVEQVVPVEVPQDEPVGAPPPIEVDLAGAGALEGRVFVMGEDPPFDVPAAPAQPPDRVLPLVAVVPPGIAPEAAARLRLLAARLGAVRPPKMWGDWTDQLRLDTWRDRCAAARARWPDTEHAAAAAGARA